MFIIYKINNLEENSNVILDRIEEMSNENDRLREFISPLIDLEKFLDDTKNLKQRIQSYSQANPCDENTLEPLMTIAKTLSDYREIDEVNQNEVDAAGDDDNNNDNDDDETTSSTWRTRRKKQKLPSSIANNLKSFPACIEYFCRKLKRLNQFDIRECNQVPSNINDERLLLSLQIFFPIESRDRYRHQLMNELICLSTLTLAQIRDAIECISDEQILGEYSENPDAMKTSGQRAGDINTAACFIIESIIYDDLRRTDQRLSEKILEQNSSIYSQGTNMETTNLIQLKTIQLGKPYIYLHQTNCEHVIVFSELKSLEQDQCHDAKYKRKRKKNF